MFLSNLAFKNEGKFADQQFKIMYKGFLKRTIDFLVAFAGLIVLLPLLLFAAAFLWVNNKGSIFFIQQRPGKNAKLFNVIKFKTMNDKKDQHGKLLPDKERLTAAGKFIRSTSIDELPQLINVLKGDMSLIGPRPLLPKYLPLYNEQQKKRHSVRPGITGWAQVNGRNAISWSQKFEYDVWYVNNLSFLVDLKIVWLTLKKIISREGINSNESATMAPFTGNN
jgi:undecaprenyl phosphate N,N'-diacetylbacillosamine 1-phosphate transferase